MVVNASLNEFITTNFSDEYKHHLSEIWGLTPSESSPFESNPLLRLQFSRWRETIYLFTKIFCKIAGRSIIPTTLDALKALCLARTNQSNSNNHTTMRLPQDPLLPTLQRLWYDSVRVWACHIYAYATPTLNAIDSLIRCAPLVEVGAGTGYWTKMIENRVMAIHQSDRGQEFGISCLPQHLVIQAFDKDPPGCRLNCYHGQSHSWTSTISQATAIDSIVTAHRRLNSKGKRTPLSLFLCYPPPDSDMALQSLRHYISLEGHTVCYVGEYRGDTGTKSFEKLLESSFSCIKEVLLPNWGDTAYSLTIWKRRESINSAPLIGHPSRKCVVCGLCSDKSFRCRVTYSVTFCSENCATTSRGKDIFYQELTYRCLYEKYHSCENSEVAVSSSGISSESKTKKRKKREKLRKLRKVVESQVEISSTTTASTPLVEDSDDSDAEDIRTQLKKYRSEHQSQQRLEITSAGSGVSDSQRIELTPQWFMSL